MFCSPIGASDTTAVEPAPSLFPSAALASREPRNPEEFVPSRSHPVGQEAVSSVTTDVPTVRSHLQSSLQYLFRSCIYSGGVGGHPGRFRGRFRQGFRCLAPTPQHKANGDIDFVHSRNVISSHPTVWTTVGDLRYQINHQTRQKRLAASATKHSTSSRGAT